MGKDNSTLNSSSIY